MKKYEAIDYNISKLDSPIKIYHPNRLKLTLAIMLETKSNHWKMTKDGQLFTEDNVKVTYQTIKQIVDIPPYTVSKILKDMKESRTLGLSGGVTAREKTLCKLNRLVEIVFGMCNDCFFREVYPHYYDDDFMQEAQKHGVNMDDEEQIDCYCLKQKKKLKQRYEIVELPEWYRDRFPQCSRQTMKRDFAVLNDMGCFIKYNPETREYQVQNPWQL